MTSLRILLSVLAVAAVSLMLWHSRVEAEPLEHHRPAVLIKAERALARGNPDRALALLESGRAELRRNPDRAEASGLVCRAYYERGDYAAAEAACDTAVALGESNERAWSYLSNRGVMRLLLGRVDEAIHDFEAAERLNPVAWSVHRNLAAARDARDDASAVSVSALR